MHVQHNTGCTMLVNYNISFLVGSGYLKFSSKCERHQTFPFECTSSFHCSPAEVSIVSKNVSKWNLYARSFNHVSEHVSHILLTHKSSIASKMVSIEISRESFWSSSRLWLDVSSSRTFSNSSACDLSSKISNLSSRVAWDLSSCSKGMSCNNAFCLLRVTMRLYAEFHCCWYREVHPEKFHTTPTIKVFLHYKWVHSTLNVEWTKLDLICIRLHLKKFTTCNAWVYSQHMQQICYLLLTHVAGFIKEAFETFKLRHYTQVVLFLAAGVALGGTGPRNFTCCPVIK